MDNIGDIYRKLDYDDFPEERRWNYGTYVGDVWRNAKNEPVYAGKLSLKYPFRNLYETALQASRSKNGLTEPGSFSYTKNGRTVNYGSHNIGPYANLLRSGVLDKPVDEQYNMPLWQIESAMTGIPDYRKFYNDYWAKIPNKDWNKVFNGRTGSVWTGLFRQPHNTQYAGTNPVRYQPPENTTIDNAYFRNDTGSVMFPRNNEQVNEMLNNASTDARYVALGVPQPKKNDDEGYDDAYIGKYTGAVTDQALNNNKFNWKRISPLDMLRLSIQGHELTHANQIDLKSRDEMDFYKDTEIKAVKLDSRLTPAEKEQKIKEINDTYNARYVNEKGRASHPTLKGEPGVAFMNSYTGNRAEEAQAIRAFKRGFLGLQHLAKQNSPETMGLTQDEYNNILNMNPMFESSAEMEKAMDWFRSHPHAGLMLGAEAGRALDMADNHAFLTKYVPGTKGLLTWEQANADQAAVANDDPVEATINRLNKRRDLRIEKLRLENMLKAGGLTNEQQMDINRQLSILEFRIKLLGKGTKDQEFYNTLKNNFYDMYMVNRGSNLNNNNNIGNA